MIFNQQNRDAPEKLLGALAASLEQNLAAESLFDLAIFCTNITWKEQGYKPGLRNPLLPGCDVGTESRILTGEPQI